MTRLEHDHPIVVGIDGSTSACHAALWAAAQAHRRGLPLRLVHAYEIPVGYPPGVVAPGAVRNALGEQGSRWLREARNAVTRVAPGLESGLGLERASVVPALVEESRRAAMIVLGTRGRGGFTGLLIGSTAVAVAGRAHCPVVVVRGEELVGSTIAATEPPFAEVVATGSPTLIPDWTAVLPDGLAIASGEFGPALAVPLGAVNRVSGVLLALRDKGNAQYAQEQVPLLASFADQTALALELADKQRQQRQLDLLADRDRIAGDLHDHVIQRLFATGMSLQGGVRRITDPEARRRVTGAVEQLDQTVQEIRTSIFDLHTSEDDSGVSLRRRMLDTVAELSAHTPVSPSVRIDGAVDTLVPLEIGEHALAVLREAVSNALRHAQASEIIVTVEAGDNLVVDVVDNGVGIPTGTARSGLLGVERRAAKCGGTATVGPGSSGGTRLTWRVPLV